MGRSRSSARWLNRHVKDSFVQRARRQGYRSRAAFKLLEIQDKDKLIKPGDVVVDLGAAPGGWSQVAKHLVGTDGAVFALDLLPMEPLMGVTCIQGDFHQDQTVMKLRAALGGRRVDLVISDMAPNLSGITAVDQPRAMLLSELALEFAAEVLNQGGALAVKVFHGEGFDAFVKSLRCNFTQVVTRKPKSSRVNSREVYLVARNYDS